MIKDNDWHDCILVKLKPGAETEFAIFESKEEALRLAKNDLPDQIQWQAGRFNWNNGQPLFDFGGNESIASIVDIQKAE